MDVPKLINGSLRYVLPTSLSTRGPLVGTKVGKFDGPKLGTKVGKFDGPKLGCVEGEAVGAVGLMLGMLVGAVGLKLGMLVGAVGEKLGTVDGCAEGTFIQFESEVRKVKRYNQ